MLILLCEVSPDTISIISGKRYIGITRVSAEGDRETVHSYDTQASRIKRDVEAEDGQLLYIGKERNVSGGATLTNRPELSKAVAAVEAGEADVIVAAYFDRFFRSMDVQSEVLRRVEKAGGEVLALDHGRLTNGTPSTRLHANIVGAIAQNFREITSVKVKEGHVAVVAAGKLPYPKVPLGYLKGEDGCLTPDGATSAVVVELFERRVAGESIHALSRWLTDQGYRKSTTGIRTILRSRVYLGEIHFGELKNLKAHKPIVDEVSWRRAQRSKGTSGRPPLGVPRLLARLGILRCVCGANMVLGSSSQVLPVAGPKIYYHYRCGSNPRCGTRQVIQASIVEPYVEDAAWEWVRERGLLGTATPQDDLDQAHHDFERDKLAFEAAVSSFKDAGIDGEPIAIDTLIALRQARDVSLERLDKYRSRPTTMTIAYEDRGRTTFDDSRELISLAIKSVTILPGRGTDRIRIEFFPKDPTSDAIK